MRERQAVLDEKYSMQGKEEIKLVPERETISCSRIHVKPDHRSQENLVRPSCLVPSLSGCCKGSLPCSSYTPPLVPSFRLIPSSSGGSQPPLISTLGCTLLPCTSCACHPYFSVPVGISFKAASESLGSSSFTAASTSAGGGDGVESSESGLWVSRA